MYSEIVTCGANEVLGYLIKRPRTENDNVDIYLSELSDDVEFYFNNAFKEKISKELVNHKKGRAYCDFELTFAKDGLYSFIILMSGYDGNDLVAFDHECITLNLEGELLPEWMMIKKQRRKKKSRNYYIDEENKVCVTKKTSEFSRLKIRRKELRGLLDTCEVYKRIT